MATPRLCEIVTVNPDIEIDLDEALKALEAAAPPGPKPKQDPPDPGGEGPLDWDKAFADIITGRHFHPTLTPLASSCAARGVSEASALTALHALLVNAQTTDPERIARRDTELGKLKETVRSGYAKFAPQPTGLFDPWQPFIAPEFPLDVLPQVASDFIQGRSLTMGVDRSAVAMSTLAAFSGAIHHRYRIRMTHNTDWLEHVRLWVLLVGRVACKKSPTIDATLRPIEWHQAKRMREYRDELRDYKARKKAGDQEAEEPELPERYIVSDATTEKLGEILSRSERGVLAKLDEVAGWIGRMERYHSAGKGASADRAFWLQAWNGGPYNVDRVKSGETFVANLSVSILGGIQPARLHEIHGLTSDGLLQRFLPVLMREPTLPQDIDCSQSAREYEALIDRLIAMPQQRLQLTEGAVGAMAALTTHLHHLEKVGEALSSGFEGHVGKLPAYAGVLTAILHLIGDNPQDRFVGRTTVEKVDRIVRGFLLPHAREFYQSGESEGERLRKLASYVLTCRKDHLRLTDLTSNVRDCRGLTVQEVNERVSPLVAGGWLIPVGVGDSPPSPTACHVWGVNRDTIDAQFAERARSERERKLAVAQLMGAPPDAAGG